MSFVKRQVAHCDQCSHEWLVVVANTPKHCAKCKSRRWNNCGDSSAVETRPHKTHDIGSNPVTHTKPTRQALREICAGKLASDLPTSLMSIGDIIICGKRWWEDGTQYECLMDKGHRDHKHGLRGMVQRLED